MAEGEGRAVGGDVIEGGLGGYNVRGQNKGIGGEDRPFLSAAKTGGSDMDR